MTVNELLAALSKQQMSHGEAEVIYLEGDREVSTYPVHDVVFDAGVVMLLSDPPRADG